MSWDVFDKLADSIDHFNQRIDQVAYWFSPGKWLGNEWAYYTKWIRDGQADEYFIVATIALVWLIMLGASWPKKYIYWSWIVFWIIKGVGNL